MNKSFWIILAGAIIALGGIFIIMGGKAEDTSTTEFPYVEPYTDQQSHDLVTGTGAKGTIIEYADFQCPFCGQYFPLLGQVKQTYGDDIKIIFRNFPIPSSHAQAMAAHRAAGAAAKQGKFWEMHDMLFSNQTEWSGNTGAAAIFEGYAEEISLNMDQYRADVGSDSVANKISADVASADKDKLNVTATPTFFWNGQKLENPPKTIDEWTALIEDGTLPAAQ